MDDYDEPESYDYTHKKEKDIGYKSSSYDKPYGFDSSKYIDQYTDSIYSISDQYNNQWNGQYGFNTYDGFDSFDSRNYDKYFDWYGDYSYDDVIKSATS